MECEQTADCGNPTAACSNSELRIFQAGVNLILNFEAHISIRRDFGGGDGLEPLASSVRGR